MTIKAMWNERRVKDDYGRGLRQISGVIHESRSVTADVQATFDGSGYIRWCKLQHVETAKQHFLETKVHITIINRCMLFWPRSLIPLFRFWYFLSENSQKFSQADHRAAPGDFISRAPGAASRPDIRSHHGDLSQRPRILGTTGGRRWRHQHHQKTQKESTALKRRWLQGRVDHRGRYSLPVLLVCRRVRPVSVSMWLLLKHLRNNTRL